MTKYVVSLPDLQDHMLKTMKMTPAERRAPRWRRIPRPWPSSSLPVQDYLVGVPALRMALLAAQGAANNPNIVASPANVAFAKTNLALLKPKIDAAHGIGRQK